MTGDNTPASMSPKMITEILRGTLGYDGIIITDALNMGAVTSSYSSADAAVRALQAGNDMLLMPENFQEAYQLPPFSPVMVRLAAPVEEECAST